jgi:hypothetical protein
MNVLVRGFAFGVLGAVTATITIFGGATLVQSGASANHPAGPLAELSIRGPGTDESAGTAGTITAVAKPKDGGTSTTKQRCHNLLADIHTALQWAQQDQANGNTDDALDNARFASQLLAQAEKEGCV